MKRKILIYITGSNGVVHHRLIMPYCCMQDMYEDEFQIDYYLEKGQPLDYFESMVSQYDYFVFSRYMEETRFAIAKKHCKVVCDNDDYWNLNANHPIKKQYDKLKPIIVKCMRESDIVTTTTELLASKIRQINSNVYAFNNGLTKDFEMPSDNSDYITGRLRFGIIGGSSHTNDMKLIEEISQYIPEDIKNNIQLVLCGFDIGMYKDEKGEPITVSAKYTCWGDWERQLTNNYKYVNESHRAFLNQFIEKADDYYDDYYRRLWTRPASNYMTLYDNIDVLIVPLQDNEFNSYKSPLKIVEASVKHKGLIISDVKPYSEYLNSDICLKVKPVQKSRGFAQAIIKYYKNKDLLRMHLNNLTKLTDPDEVFNLRAITEKRKEIFK